MTSSCLIFLFELITIDRTTLIIVALTRRLNISSKSIPSRCENPIAKIQALNLSIVPSTLNFVLNTHFDPIKFIPGDLGTKIYVLLICKTSISSCIDASQFGSLTISLLLQETSNKCRSFALFLVPKVPQLLHQPR